MCKCEDCDKIFEFPYLLKRHQNSKKPCKNNIDNKCHVCNINFNYPSHLKQHNKTKRHINIISMNNSIIGDNNSIDNSITANINNIIQMFNPVNTFNNTNINYIDEFKINSILEDRDNNGNNHINKHIEEIRLDDESNYTDHYKDKFYSLIFIQYLIDIFKELNFSIATPENHNCKVLVFIKNNPQPAVTKSQYLILEIKDNTVYQWTEITYKDFIYELFQLMTLINNRYEINNLNYIMEYLNKYFKDNEYIQDLSKSDIEGQLYALSNIFTYDRNDVNLSNNINKHIKKETNLLNGIEANVKFITDFLTQD